jgi:phosphoglycolate phosphatase-like HAD superfamily hydrolase
MTNINNYDLFLFDLDGTLINTEEIHFQSYLESLSKYGYTKSFTFDDYCKICHLDDIAMQKFVENNLNIIYEKFYQTKKSIYLSKLNESLCLINGFDIFLQELKKLNKKTCIVTHSSRDTIEFILEKLPILKTIDKIISNLAYYGLNAKKFGGNERKIYTENRPEFKDKLFRVLEIKIVKTGVYQKSLNENKPASIENMKSIPTFAQYLQKTGGDKDLAHAAGLMPKNKMN